MAILISIIFSKIIFSSYRSEQVMESYGNIYYLQYATFTNKEVMNDNIKKLDSYIIYDVDNKYYVHLGIYANLDTALKVKKILENEDVFTYIKSDYISDTLLIKEIRKNDNLVMEESDINKILEINKKNLEYVKNSIS